MRGALRGQGAGSVTLQEGVPVTTHHQQGGGHRDPSTTATRRRGPGLVAAGSGETLGL